MSVCLLTPKIGVQWVWICAVIVKKSYTCFIIKVPKLNLNFCRPTIIYHSDRSDNNIVTHAGNNNFHSKSPTANGLITCLLAFSLTALAKSTRVQTLLHNVSPLYILYYAYISHSLLTITILALVRVSHSNTTVILVHLGPCNHSVDFITIL